jgi:hypothetical protein
MEDDFSFDSLTNDDLYSFHQNKKRNTFFGIKENESSVIIPELNTDEKRKSIQRIDGYPWSSGKKGEEEKKKAGFAPDWVKEEYERRKIVESNQDYKFIELVAGFANTAADRLIITEDSTLRDARQAAILEQQSNQIRNNDVPFDILNKIYQRLLTEIGEIEPKVDYYHKLSELCNLVNNRFIRSFEEIEKLVLINQRLDFYKSLVDLKYYGSNRSKKELQVQIDSLITNNQLKPVITKIENLVNNIEYGVNNYGLSDSEFNPNGKPETDEEKRERERLREIEREESGYNDRREIQNLLFKYKEYNIKGSDNVGPTDNLSYLVTNLILKIIEYDDLVESDFCTELIKILLKSDPVDLSDSNSIAKSIKSEDLYELIDKFGSEPSYNFDYILSVIRSFDNYKDVESKYAIEAAEALQPVMIIMFKKKTTSELKSVRIYDAIKICTKSEIIIYTDERKKDFINFLFFNSTKDVWEVIKATTKGQYMEFYNNTLGSLGKVQGRGGTENIDVFGNDILNIKIGFIRDLLGTGNYDIFMKSLMEFNSFKFKDIATIEFQRHIETMNTQLGKKEDNNNNPIFNETYVTVFEKAQRQLMPISLTYYIYSYLKKIEYDARKTLNSLNSDRNGLEEKIKNMRVSNFSIQDIDYPPKNNRAWVELPEHSGVINMKPLLVAGIAKAYDVLNTGLDLKSQKVSFETLQRNEHKTKFAELVAGYMSLIQKKNPNKYDNIKLLEYTKTDIRNLLNRFKKIYKKQPSLVKFVSKWDAPF